MIARRLPRSHRVRLLDQPSFQNPLLVDMRCLPLVAEMNRNGILIDPGVLLALDGRLAEKAAGIDARVFKAVGHPINLGSGDQVAQLLFDELKIMPLRRTKSGKRAAVDESSLVYLRGSHPIVDLILDHREVVKLRGTYVGPLIEQRGEDGRIRTRLSMTTARTGRLASESPNLQNQPTRTEDGRQIRSAFIVGKGNRLASIDLVQIEMVVAAHDSGDEAMCEVFRKGEDIHVRTACALFDDLELDYDEIAGLLALIKCGQASEDEIAWIEDFRWRRRLPAKSLGFAVLFGILALGLQAQILEAGGPLIGLEECQAYIDRWFAQYPGVQRMMEATAGQAIRYGLVWNMFGRTRPMPAARSAIRRVRAEALRQACNHRIQSGAQDIIKVAMAEILDLTWAWRECWPKEVCLPLLQIHDELLFELSAPIAEDFCQEVKAVMETCVPLDVPVRAEYKIGENWAELK